MAVARPLPGIRFEAPAPPVGDALPRMDIPVFVGFAASGPVDLPVAVEDAAHFESIFGAALPLVREAGSNVPLTAYLAPTVRAFFRNGGRRCWIVRVARNARANRFRIPGLQSVAEDGTLSDAYGVARSEGSWSDGLLVQTSLSGTALRLAGLGGVLGTPAFVDAVPAAPRDLAAGDLLRLSWLGGTARVLFLFVETLGAVPLSSPPSPPPPRGAVRIAGRAVWLPDPPPDLAALTGQPVLEKLTFEIAVHAAGQPPLRLAGLGFSPAHPFSWGDLPDDAALFANPGTALSALWAAAATPRFPLAAAPGGAFFVPAGMGVLFSPEQPAEIPAGTALERDGLAQFDAGLFLDPDLADATVRDLLERADFLRDQSPAPRALTGIHAALGIDEATMIAVPDAVHRGWVREASPVLSSPLASSPLDHPEWWRWLACDPPNPPRPGGVPLGGGGFVSCEATTPVEVPFLSATAPVNGAYELFWSPATDPTDPTDRTDPSDLLEEATRPDFSDAALIASGTASGTAARVTLYGRASGDYFYRVRRVRGARTSDWSNGVAVRVAAALGWESVEAADYDDAALVAVHTALVTLCAARGDLVALLSLPGHYGERQAIAHPARLALDSRVLSYGALWHPWLLLRDGPDGDSSPLKTIPPDGATAGVMAARAIARGAWIAPANEPLRGPVALVPPLAAELRQALQDAAVNVIRQEPSGFVCLDADTLSPDGEVRALNVRRLLALVRRFALRVGEPYVFEPNGDIARRAVRRAFEAMLETLFLRGAFAGATEKTSFQVVTGDALDTPASLDAGRLIAEIRIAPSRPLSFLTIRLVQSGGGSEGIAIQEAAA